MKATHRLCTCLLLLLFIPGLIRADTIPKQGKINLAEDVELEELVPGIWLHTTYYSWDGGPLYPANGLVLLDGVHAALIDLPWTNEQTAVLFDWIQAKHGAVVEFVVPTHSHVDCAGGLAEAHKRGARSFSLDKTAQFLETNREPVPDVCFSERLFLRCGDIKVELAYYGGGHTVDNIVAWMPEENILFGGCMVRSADTANLGFTQEADIPAWPETLAKISKAYPSARVVVPGHGRPGGLELLEHTIDLLQNHQ